MNHDNSVWSGLGQRAGAAPAAPPSDDEQGEVDGFARESVQRTIPAAGAASVIPAGAVVSPFILPFRPAAGSARDSDTDSAATPKKKEPRMSEPSESKPRAVRNVQLRILRAIEAGGGVILRTDLAKALPDLDTKQISQGIFQVTASSRAQKHMTDAGWKLKLARACIAFLKTNGASEADAAAPPKKPTRRKLAKAVAPVKTRRASKAKAKTPRKKPKTRRAAVRVHQPQPAAAPVPSGGGQVALVQPAVIQMVQERSFRCAVISDGGFFLHKGDQQIDLTAAEHREMLNYIDRVRGVDTPEPARA